MISDEQATSELLYQALAEAVPAMVGVTDAASGTLVYANRGWTEYTGLTLEQINADRMQFIHPDDRERVMAASVASRRAGEPLEVDYRVRRHDGVFRWHLWRAVPVRDFEGNVVQWIGTTTDVDDRKRMELALRESEARYRALSNAMPAIVLMTDASGNFTYFNDRWFEYSGIDRASAPNETWLEAFHPADLPEVGAVWQRGIEQRERVSLEYRLRRHDGEYRWHLGIAEPILDGGDRIAGWISTIIDIEDMKRAQQTAYESEAHYRSLSEAMPALVVAMNPSGAFEYCNDAYLAYIGLTLEEANEWDQRGLIHPDDERQATEVWLNAMASGASFQNEFRLRRRDGEYRWHLVNGVAVKDASGDLLRWISVSMDIEERKRAEEALADSQYEVELERNRLEVVTNAMPALISYIDREWRYQFVNKGYQDWFGLAPDEIVGRTLAEVLGEAALDRLRPYVARALAGELVEFEDYTPYERGGGRWISATYRPDAGPDGSVRGIFVLVLDVSARKREELTKRVLADVSDLMASTLNYNETIENVVRATVPSFADAAALYILDEARSVAKVSFDASSGIAVSRPHTVDREREWRVAASLASGVSSMPDGDDQAPPQAIVVPMSVRGAVVGALAFEATQRTYNAGDLQTAEEIARRASLAIENARLYSEARAALQNAEAANDNLRFLTEASAIVGESMEYEKTLENLARLAVSHLSDNCVVDLKVGEGYERIVAVGRDTRKIGDVARVRERYSLDADANHSSAYTLRTGKRDYVPQVTDELLRSFSPTQEAFDAVKALSLRSYLTEPLVSRGKLLGAISFSTTGDRELTPTDVALAGEFTRRAATALDNAQLYRATTDALEQREDALLEAETANANLRFLAEARAMLSESLGFDEALDGLMKTIVPRMGDYASVVLRRADGSFERVASAVAPRGTPAYTEAAIGFEGDAADGVPHVISTGQAEVIDDIHGRYETDLLSREDRHAHGPGSSLRSAILLPIRFSDGTSAALSIASTTAGRYREEDLELLGEFAHRASVALDNARLFSDLRETAEELRRANAAKDEFLGLVSHELKTPITTIMGNAEVLYRRGEELDDESRAGALVDIRNDAERLHRIIENLLVLARLERGARFEREPLLLHRLAERLADEHRRRYPRRLVRVVCDESSINAALAEPGYVDLVMRNLLSNAEKYSPVREPIDVVVESHGNEVTVRVLDRGAGFPPEESEKIFDAFYRSSTVSPNIQGIGIGLAVCKRLIEVQRGRVWAMPRAGGGSEIAFALPAVGDDQ